MAVEYEVEHPRKAYGWAARDTSGLLSPFFFSRRKTGEKDVTFKVLYCGLCHSDLHKLKNEWNDSIYPLVPGREIVGEVMEVGSKVEKFKIGDKVAVGCLVGSCSSCQNCVNNLENYCQQAIHTYGSKYVDDSITYGGFSDFMVVDEHFVVNIPNGLPLDVAAPLLCAGITVYAPLRYFGLDKPGMHLGVVGLGGLGHLAVKFAKALGLKVTVISTSPSKEQEAIQHLGADYFVLSRDQDQMKSHGKLVTVGAPEKPLELLLPSLILGRKSIAGSYFGGIKETQEMIDFAAEHNVRAEIEVIPMDYVNTAMERLLKADVKYRFVIDVGNTLKPYPSTTFD
ncbi:probable mannitol dehydrogenase isoform X2 [Vigna angularis]|uniref:probable mannitol dehydrogenase isoform X2 n=1 Tax=Phaseolus angularis TaxID=3914 RepID=UPI0022B34E14|nr:probable mannitol dehydrogenase isoform X2 [Vigna angularis]